MNSRNPFAALQKVHHAARKLLHDPDFEALEIVMAAVLANQQKGDAVALFLVGPPATGKTEFIMACSEVTSTYWLSTLSSNTLASGLHKREKGDEPALLDQLSAEGQTTLLFKEFGSVLSKPSMERTELIGQLRDIMDGSYRKRFGSSKDVNWRGTLGMIAGVTPEIEKHWATVRALGDRWLMLRTRTPIQPLMTALEAMDRSAMGKGLRKSLSSSVVQHLKFVGKQGLNVDCSKSNRELIGRAAVFLANARTPISRDGYSRRITHSPEPEGPSRLAKTLFQFALAMAAIRGQSEVGDAEISSIYRLVKDTIPSIRFRLLSELGTTRAKTAELAKALKLPASSIHDHMEDLEVLGFVESSVAVEDDQNTDSPKRRGAPPRSWWRVTANEELVAPWESIKGLFDLD